MHDSHESPSLNRLIYNKLQGAFGDKNVPKLSVANRVVGAINRHRDAALVEWAQ